MTGEEVRKILLENNVILSDLAIKLGITPQTLNSRFNARNFKEEYVSDIENILGFSLNSFEKTQFQDSSLKQLIINNTKLTESIQVLAETNAKLSNKILELVDKEKMQDQGALDAGCVVAKASSDE
jgi:transcriptional regulator with XRE-family HTH domain